MEGLIWLDKEEAFHYSEEGQELRNDSGFKVAIFDEVTIEISVNDEKQELVLKCVNPPLHVATPGAISNLGKKRPMTPSDKKDTSKATATVVEKKEGEGEGEGEEMTNKDNSETKEDGGKVVKKRKKKNKKSPSNGSVPSAKSFLDEMLISKD